MPPFVARQQLWAIVINPTLYSPVLDWLCSGSEEVKAVLECRAHNQSQPTMKAFESVMVLLASRLPTAQSNKRNCPLSTEVCQLFNRIIAISQNVAMVMCVQCVEIGTQQVHVLNL